ncbi:MAG TPA: hypothetical protein VGO63_02840 [Candidatus Paceibacterota bacterium]|jgi:hypothetical protein|nr:hypothetical protein [Candidatus Paceibacterota bacterium]
MDTEDIKKIELLLEKGDYNSVRQIVEKMVEKNLTDEERGEGLAAIASVYLDISNAINENYVDALREAIEGMKKINQAEKVVKEDINVRDIRAKLQNSM